jgi:hypothetical protein
MAKRRPISIQFTVRSGLSICRSGAATINIVSNFPKSYYRVLSIILPAVFVNMVTGLLI